jgi:hypothetical protein
MRCTHEEPEMVLYEGHALGAHRTVHWCPRCGALGVTDYASDKHARWRKPQARAAARGAKV